MGPFSRPSNNAKALIDSYTKHVDDKCNQELSIEKNSEAEILLSDEILDLKVEDDIFSSKTHPVGISLLD